MANNELTAFEFEDFVMTSEINFNLQGWKWSEKMMKNQICWEEWYEVRKRQQVKDTIASNNVGGLFDDYKAEYQAGRGKKWLKKNQHKLP